MDRPIPGKFHKPGEQVLYIEVFGDEGAKRLVDEYGGAAFETPGRRGPTSRVFSSIVDGSLAVSPDLILTEDSAISGAGALIVLPDGKVLYGLSYRGALDRLQPRFFKYCTATGRKCGELEGESVSFLDGTKISLSDCRIVFYSPKRKPFRSAPRSEAEVSLSREPKWEATKLVAQLANELLNRPEDTPLEMLQIFEFEGDSANLDAHNDDLHESLMQRFTRDFDRVRSELAESLGNPVRTSNEDDPSVPVGGAFRTAVWKIGDRSLYLAAAHEDRELPYLLFIGVSDQN